MDRFANFLIFLESYSKKQEINELSFQINQSVKTFSLGYYLEDLNISTLVKFEKE